MSTNTVQPSVQELEQLLYRAAIDAEFRSEFLSNPEAFGIPANTELVVPQSVQKQDESFFELLKDDLEGLEVRAECKNTCTSGPITLVCDGTTK